MRPMRGRLIVALALVAVGLVWVGQGLGLLRGSSFMIDDVRWAVLGAVLVLVGGAIALSARRRPKA
jgi:hypothetical protein